MNLYHDINRLKAIESVEDLITFIKKEGYPLNDFSYDKNESLAYTCYKLAWITRTNDLAPEERSEENIQPDASLYGNFFTFLILLGNPKELFGISSDALEIIKSSNLAVRIEDLVISDLINKPYFLYSLSGEPLFDDVINVSVFVDDVDYLCCIINLTDGKSFSHAISFDDINQVLYEQNNSMLDIKLLDPLVKRKLTNNANHILKKTDKGFFLVAQFVLLLNCEKTPILSITYIKKIKRTHLQKSRIKRVFPIKGYL